MAKKIQRSNMTQTDSKGKVMRAPRDNAMGEAINFRWWTVEEEINQAQAIAQTVKFIQTRQSSRMEQLTVSTRLYGNTTAYNLMGTAFTRASSVNSSPSSNRLSYNLCASVVDTLVSKMAKNKVIPTYITNGGVWKVQKKAKQLTKFTQGVFYEQDVHTKSINAFRDGGVWGDGFVHVFRKDDKIAIERVLPHELVVDMLESMCTDPRQMFRVKIMDRDVAFELFPELEENIATVSPANYQDIGGAGTTADLITVIEAWHLKSGPDAEDGVHAISIGDGVWKEAYEKDYFPFPHFTYSQRLLGYYGQGAVERLQSLQGELNRGMMTIQKSHWMMAGPKIAVEMTSKIPTQHLTNDIASIIHYSEHPPMYLTPPIIQPEVYQWVDSLIEKGYRQEGVSTLSANGEHPLGVDSGKALRVLTNVEDDRFLFVGQQMENFVLEIARQAIEVAKDIYEDKGSYEVIFPNTRFMETVDWKNINLEQEEYVLKAYPTSSLSDDLSGRLADIQELMQAGLVSPRTGKRLMDMPDVEMEDNLSNAAEDMLHRIFEDILDDGKYRTPEPFYDQTLGKQLCLEYYNYAEYMGAPDERLAMLSRWNDDLQDMVDAMAQAAANKQATMQMQAQQQAQQQGQPGSQPMANPAPTPQSNLVNNTAGATQ